MSYEVSLLVFAMVLFFLDLTLLSKSRNKGEQKRRIGFCAALLGFVLIVVSYALLLQAFVSNNFSFSSVYSYSSSGLPLLSKIYASWAGAAGSMLFLTFLLGVIYVGLRFRILRRPDDFSIATGQVFCIILIVFLMVCLVRDPFERLVITPFEGRGLNPQLQTLWMTIHPPIVFSAYAFVLLAYSSILASMRTKRELNDLRIFRGSTYVAWLLLTTGIVLGGVWAYEVLGWGGYWAWDPVETASLLPWLFLTAYFHVGQLSKHKKSFTRESMVFMTFTSLVFLTALTRGGFTQSVHSYAMSPVGLWLLISSI
jgi:cytochrome c-type biogenesis protein CcmF